MSRLIVSFFMFILAISGMAQTRVSKPLADAINQGKFYMKMYGTQSDENEDEDVPTSIVMTMEMAQKGKVFLSSANTGHYTMANLFANGKRYMLDANSKTYQTFPGMPGQSSMLGTLTFKQQGTCRVNGNDGWYYDAYTSSMGMNVTFYYNSNKVAIVDIEEMGGAMSLMSFNKRIPDNVHLGITAGWKGQGSPAPPTVAAGYKDADASVEMACGEMLKEIVITDKRPISKPVYASSFSAPAGGDGNAAAPTATGDKMDITTIGIKKAYEELLAWCEDKDADEVVDAIYYSHNNYVSQIIGGNICGTDVERALARAIIIPSPTIISGACAGYIATGHVDEALPILEELHKIVPDDASVVENLVECYMEKRKATPAMILINQTADTMNRGELFAAKGMILFEQGKYDEGFDALFHALSLGYCDEEMAQVLIQTKTYITCHLPRKDNPAMDGKSIDEVMNRIFSKENLDLLRMGITFGPEYEDAKMHRELHLDWKYGIATVEACRQGLSDNEARVSRVYDEAKAAADYMNNIFCMCDENLLRMKEMTMQANEGLDLEGSSVFWSAFMLSVYYELRLNYETGFYASEDMETHKLEGWFSEGYGSYFNRMRTESAQIDRKVESIDERIKQHDEKVESNPSADDLVTRYALQDEKARLLYEETIKYSNNVLGELLKHYGQNVRPLAEEYVRTMEKALTRIPDEGARHMLFYQAHSEVLMPYMRTIHEGAEMGDQLNLMHEHYDQAHGQYVAMWEEFNKEKFREEQQRIEKILKAEAYKEECKYFEVDPLKNYDPNSGLLPEFSRYTRDLDLFGLFSISAGTKHGRIFFELRNNATGETKGYLPQIEKKYKKTAVDCFGRDNGDLYKDWIANKVKSGAQDLFVGSFKLMPLVGDKASDIAGRMLKGGKDESKELTWYYDKNGALLRRGFEHKKTYSAGGNFSYTHTTEITRDAARTTVAIKRHRHSINYDSDAGNFTVGWE